MKPMSLITIGRSWFGNVTSSGATKPHSLLIYVVGPRDWVTKQVGVDITKCLNSQKLLKAKTSTSYQGTRNQIVHFGSRDIFLPDVWKKVDPSNKIVFTWFHGDEGDKNPANLAMIKALPEASRKADIVHTSCTISKNNLLRWGVPQDKLVVVPLGIDLDIFKPVSPKQKVSIRKGLGLPQDKIIIGSFQKDGRGWGEGLEPKWVKGPDIFINVINRLKTDYDIFVLLTGPSRGYIKRELDRIGVPYKHFFLKDYPEIPKYYNALDLYLVTSRAEGGPKAILESMATGVPIVSTRVGMAPDITKDGDNGLLAEVEDEATLAEKAAKCIKDKHLVEQLVSHALNTVKNYSWQGIAREYYDKIYRRWV